MNRIIKVLLVIFGSIAIDQVTKIWARNKFEGQGESSYFNDMFRWIFAENEGAFLGWGSDLTGIPHFLLMKLLPSLLILGLLYMTLFRKDFLKNQIVPFSLILGGGLSNLFDRVVHGKVVDFMNMGIGDLRTGIFNVADMVIMTGIIWYVFTLFSKEAKEANAKVKAEKEASTSTIHTDE